VGGSWIAPVDLIEQGQWARITELAQQASAQALKAYSGESAT
jgi:2-keto-3-deoxy-6-phosphogluconate aldolase